MQFNSLFTREDTSSLPVPETNAQSSLNGRYTVCCNRAVIVVRISSYDDIGPRASHA